MKPRRSVTINSCPGQPMTLKAQLAERNVDRNFTNMPPINIPAIHNPAYQQHAVEIDVPTVVVMHSPHNSGMMVENPDRNSAISR